jgi:hypothetical protein
MSLLIAGDCVGLVADGFVADGFVEDGFVDDGFVEDGFVDDGLADDGFIPLIECSSVPLTSTLWLRYFDQLELLLPVAVRLSLLGMLADVPVVPVVPAAPVSALPVELWVASARTNCVPVALFDALGDGVVVPAVPVGLV